MCQKDFTGGGLSEKEAGKDHGDGEQSRPERAVSDYFIFARIVYVDGGESDHQH